MGPFSESEGARPAKKYFCDSCSHEVQRLITNKGLTFLLTGSSARKLKRGGANLCSPILAKYSAMSKAIPHS